jgi:hypothetical protein
MADDRFVYLVEYEDGRKAEISVDQYNFARGEWVAKFIAEVRQEKGLLPKGKIKSITRVRRA